MVQAQDLLRRRQPENLSAHLLDGDRAKACAAAWYSWSILPAIGHFVIRVGRCGSDLCGVLDLPDGTLDDAYGVSRMILLHFKCKDFEEDL